MRLTFRQAASVMDARLPVTFGVELRDAIREIKLCKLH